MLFMVVGNWKVGEGICWYLSLFRDEIALKNFQQAEQQGINVYEVLNEMIASVPAGLGPYNNAVFCHLEME